MEKKHLRNTVFSVLVFAAVMLCLFGSPVTARAGVVTVSDVYTDPANPGYIGANEWYTFGQDTTSGDDLYYTVTKKSNTYYWVRLYEEYPEGYVGKHDKSTGIGIYNADKRETTSKGYVNKDYTSCNYSNNILKGFSKWVLINPGEQILIKTHRVAGHRIYLFMMEDQYGQTKDSIPTSASFDRGDVIKGSFSKNESDYIRFRTDSTPLYRVRLFAKLPEKRPYSGEAYDFFSLGLVCYRDGAEEKPDYVPFSENEDDISHMVFGKGIEASDGSWIYYLQLEANTDYVWALTGENCTYEVSFGNGTFEELLKADFLMACTKNPERPDEYIGDGLFRYTGSPIEPSVHMKTRRYHISGTNPDGTPNGKFDLRDDNYDVTYRNNVNAGTAYAIVTGKGGLSGSFEIPFTIQGDETAPTSAPTPTAAPKPTAAPSDAQGTTPMYRLYNKNSGEHFYTANEAEKDMLAGIGWNYEGIGWTAPATSDTPVYRLYNKNGGEHHYTTSKAERDMLIGIGWNDEGIGWYSDDAKGVPLYRQYNPNAFANNHNYTSSKAENDWLVSLGWKAEGVGWYGVK